MKNTFFDSLMISDSERIHTQTLSWIFKLNGDIFPTLQKEKFVTRLFNLEEQISIESVYIETELNSIDLFLDFGKNQIIIENKLKSSEHSNQTTKYINSIPEKFNSEKIKHFGFLTLTSDKPQNENWTPISFEKLLIELKKVNWKKNERDYIFVEEYINTLSNLVNVFNDFMTNHQKYSNVFNDGFKKKHDKNRYDDDYLDYVRVNQLETIFQKAFLNKIIGEIEFYDYEINETRGTALIQVKIKEVSINNEKFYIGFQFQGRTLKINVSHWDYGNSKAEMIDENLIEAFGKSFHRFNDFNRLNKPRSKAYISVSKSIGKELYQLTKEEIKNTLTREIKSLKLKIPKFEERINPRSTKSPDLVE